MICHQQQFHQWDAEVRHRISIITKNKCSKKNHGKHFNAWFVVSCELSAAVQYIIIICLRQGNDVLQKRVHPTMAMCQRMGQNGKFTIDTSLDSWRRRRRNSSSRSKSRKRLFFANQQLFRDSSNFGSNLHLQLDFNILKKWNHLFIYFLYCTEPIQ